VPPQRSDADTGDARQVITRIVRRVRN
jgi:hypothetical protein